MIFTRCESDIIYLSLVSNCESKAWRFPGLPLWLATSTADRVAAAPNTRSGSTLERETAQIYGALLSQSSSIKSNPTE
jgi:hypothetical protein